MISAFKQLIQYMDGKTTKTEVVNQLTSISTPDIDKVVAALSKLDVSTAKNKLDLSPLAQGIKGLEAQLKLIPKTLPEQQKIDISSKNFKAIEDAIRKIDIKPIVKVEQPNIDIKAPEVNVEAPDLKPIQAALIEVLKAINAKELPKTDLSKIEKKLDESNKHLEKLVKKPSGGGGGGGNGTSFTDSNGSLKYVALTSDNEIPVADDPTSKYKIADVDDSNDIKYYGFTKKGGAWYVLKEDSASSPKTYRYSKGSDSYDFSTRAAKSYEYFHEVF